MIVFGSQPATFPDAEKEGQPPCQYTEQSDCRKEYLLRRDPAFDPRATAAGESKRCGVFRMFRFQFLPFPRRSFFADDRGKFIGIFHRIDRNKISLRPLAVILFREQPGDHSQSLIHAPDHLKSVHIRKDRRHRRRIQLFRIDQQIKSPVPRDGGSDRFRIQRKDRFIQKIEIPGISYCRMGNRKTDHPQLGTGKGKKDHAFIAAAGHIQQRRFSRKKILLPMFPLADECGIRIPADPAFPHLPAIITIILYQHKRILYFSASKILLL